jgi:hypothetical protein
VEILKDLGYFGCYHFEFESPEVSAVEGAVEVTTRMLEVRQVKRRLIHQLYVLIYPHSHRIVQAPHTPDPISPKPRQQWIDSLVDFQNSMIKHIEKILFVW